MAKTILNIPTKQNIIDNEGQKEGERHCIQHTLVRNDCRERGKISEDYIGPMWNPYSHLRKRVEKVINARLKKG